MLPTRKCDGAHICVTYKKIMDRRKDFANISLLAAFSRSEKEELYTQCRIKQFKKGETIINEGDNSQELYFIIDGRVKVSSWCPSGREIGLSFLTGGSYFGEFSIIDGRPRSASIETAASSIIAILPYPQSKQFIFNHIKVMHQLLIDHVNMIRQQDERIMDLTDVGAPKRIHKLLLKLIHIHPKFKSEPLIHPMPTQHDIAIMTSTSRESVSRALAILYEDGVIEKSGKYLFIKKLETLKQLTLIS